MDVSFFDSLSREDFDNGAILDDIRSALKNLAELRAVAQAAQEIFVFPDVEVTEAQFRDVRVVNGLALAGLKARLKEAGYRP
jgi:hypothetical protein